jgi:hypothetical protein
MVTHTVVIPEGGEVGRTLTAECPTCKMRWSLLTRVGARTYTVNPECPKGCNASGEK